MTRAIYLQDEGQERWLDVLGQVCERFNWSVHAYCQTSNHYHLLIETPNGNLAKGMRQFDGVYTQRFNRTHNRVGHVVQGRYWAILVRKDAYLLMRWETQPLIPLPPLPPVGEGVLLPGNCLRVYSPS